MKASNLSEMQEAIRLVEEKLSCTESVVTANGRQFLKDGYLIEEVSHIGGGWSVDVGMLSRVGDPSKVCMGDIEKLTVSLRKRRVFTSEERGKQGEVTSLFEEVYQERAQILPENIEALLKKAEELGLETHDAKRKDQINSLLAREEDGGYSDALYDLLEDVYYLAPEWEWEIEKTEERER